MLPTSSATTSAGTGRTASSATLEQLLPAGGRELSAVVRQVSSNNGNSNAFRIQVEANNRLLELLTRAPLNTGDRISLSRTPAGELQLSLPMPARPEATPSAPVRALLLQIPAAQAEQLQQQLPLNTPRPARVISSTPLPSSPMTPTGTQGVATAPAAQPAASGPATATPPTATSTTATPAGQQAPVQPQPPTPAQPQTQPQTQAQAQAQTTVYRAQLQQISQLSPPASGSVPAAASKPPAGGGQTAPAPPPSGSGTTTGTTSATTGTANTQQPPAAPPSPTPAAPPDTTAPQASRPAQNPTTPGPAAPDLSRPNPTERGATGPGPATPGPTDPGATAPRADTARAEAARTGIATSTTAPAISPPAGIRHSGNALLQALGQQQPRALVQHQVQLQLAGQPIELTSNRPLQAGQTVLLTRTDSQSVQLQPQTPTTPPAPQSAGQQAAIQQALREALPQQLPFGDALNQLVQLSQTPSVRAQSSIGQMVQSMLNLFSVTPDSPDADQAIKRNLQQGGLMTEARLAQPGGSDKAQVDIKQQLGQLMKAAEQLPPESRQQMQRLVDSLQARSTSQQLNSLQAWKELPDGGQERVFRLDLPIRQADRHDTAEMTIHEHRPSPQDADAAEAFWSVALHFDLPQQGSIDARLSLHEGWRLNLNFWAQQADTLRRIERRLDSFAADLHERGFLIDQLQAHQGQPTQPRLTNVQRRLVDVHT